MYLLLSFAHLVIACCCCVTAVISFLLVAIISIADIVVIVVIVHIAGVVVAKGVQHTIVTHFHCPLVNVISLIIKYGTIRNLQQKKQDKKIDIKTLQSLFIYRWHALWAVCRVVA